MGALKRSLTVTTATLRRPGPVPWKKRWVGYGFSASARYQNLALKLAAHFGGTVVTPADRDLKLQTLVTIVDGTDLGSALAFVAGVQVEKRILVSLGLGPDLLVQSFPDHQVLGLPEVNIFQAFKQICLFLEGKASPDKTHTSTLASCFISHAVKDEVHILPATDYLRKFFRADLFLCADSIMPGDDWQFTISKALRDQDRFVVLLSQATLGSHFCSFEIGFAAALEKVKVIISLDGSRPPAFLQHLQFLDLQRIGLQRPWLSVQDLLVDQLLQALKVPSEGDD